MSHFLVLGAGKMGLVLAKDIIESEPDFSVTLVDVDFHALTRAKEFIHSDRLETVQRDIENKEQRDEVINGKDVVLCALLHRHSLPVLESAVRLGVHFVDVVGEFTLERLKFDEEAKNKAITVISGCGVSPGITNVCVGRGVELLDETENALIFVGGNPVEAKPPLKYRIVYAVNSLLGLYERKALVLIDGILTKVAALSAVEPIAFPPEFPEMECFYTDGLNSLAHTMQGKIDGELSEKTIRYKGHAAEIQTLKACGFFEREAIEVDGTKVIPRRVTESILDKRIALGDERDVTFLRVVVSGRKSGEPATHVFEMVDY
ncbi:MAG: saccharopine dehydrogenase C-terminal domain-containing protein, partial [Candidatus Aminicenantaceae bacterium]